MNEILTASSILFLLSSSFCLTAAGILIIITIWKGITEDRVIEVDLEGEDG